MVLFAAPGKYFDFFRVKFEIMEAPGILYYMMETPGVVIKWKLFDGGAWYFLNFYLIYSTRASFSLKILNCQ
jgi:hypothetical protein